MQRALVLLLFACGDDTTPPPPSDAGGGSDAGRDAGPTCVATATDFPTPQAGRCRAVVAPDALLPVGDDGAGGFITPGARRVTRVGRHVELPGFPMAVTPVPGTSFVVVTDGAVSDEQLSVIDVTSGAVVDSREFRENAPTPEALFLGLAVSRDGRTVYVSGGGSDRIYVYDLDPATGELTDASPIDVFTAGGGLSYVSAIRLLSDDRTLAINLMMADALLLYDTEARAEIARIGFEEQTYPYDLVVSPDDRSAWVSLWGGSAVVPVDLAGRRALAPIPVGKNPEGLVLSRDGTVLVATSSDSDSLAMIDVATNVVEETIWLAGETAPRGTSPAAGAFDAAGRLYIVSAGENAIDVLEDGAAGWARVGRIPTMWYPTDVEVLDDGTVLVVNGKHEGTGPSDGSVDIVDLVGGSLQIVDPIEITDPMLLAWDMEVATNNDRGTRFVEVECPDGAPYDFPIPLEGTGPSPHIEHVIVVVRENKTYDAYLGNLEIGGAPHGNGDPNLTIVPPLETAMVFPNTQELARVFTIGDNFYSQAEQSVQGHVWTTFGRTTDYVERSWLTTWGRGYWAIPQQGIGTIGFPEEGGAFQYLVNHGVEVDNFGEIVGARGAPPNGSYPGIFFALGIPDIDRAEWVAARIARCDLAEFTYMILPRDHTRGLDPEAETPRSMMADNDNAVGRLVEAVSRSSYWPRTVIFVIEDDPQNGGDHVDNHRAPVHVISPWARRGHVTSVHSNEASIYRTIQLIFGIDAPLSAYWANAAPMLDAFGSTPDYTPYDRIERAWPIEMNPDDGSEMAMQSRAYDWSKPDEQRGIARLLWRHLRGTEAPWPELPEWAEDEDEEVDEGRADDDREIDEARAEVEVRE